MQKNDRIDRIARKHNGLKTEVVKRAHVVQSELLSLDDKITVRFDKNDEKLDIVINCLKCLSVVALINLIALVVFHG